MSTTKKNQSAATEPAKTKSAAEVTGTEKQVKGLHTRIKNLEAELRYEKEMSAEKSKNADLSHESILLLRKQNDALTQSCRKHAIRIAGFQRSHRLVEQAIVLARATSVELGEQEYDKTRIFDDMHATCNMTSNDQPGPEKKSS